MSFDIFVSCYRDGEASTFPRKLAIELLGRFDPGGKDESHWVLKFPDGGWSEIYVTAGPRIGGFMVTRSPDSPEFWSGLIEILKRTTSVLYWPGGPPVVADASVIPHIPKGMIEALGEPVVTTDRDKILELIRNS
ncbi:MAG: hypothetical protein KGL11_08035 [Alphaproteobacteria bacterium]|nr:hypothetical protein [Alphaproteobacteria bacterium]